MLCNLSKYTEIRQFDSLHKLGMHSSVVTCYKNKDTFACWVTSTQ